MAQKKQPGMVLATDNWVSKSNPLNEIRNCRMTPTQQRLFSIYLSKIHPNKFDETREVAFKLEEYTRIMNFKQTNTTRLVKSAEDLLGLTVKYFDKDGKYSPDGHKGLIISQLFRRFRLYKIEDEGEWYVSIDCHDDAKNLMFDLQKDYFKYQLWNVLPLVSSNQQRIYELLKQYEYSGEREVAVKDLRAWLWLKPEEYPRWNNFKVRVLDASQVALARYTDITFTWQVTERKGKGGGITKIKFFIKKNHNYVRQLTFDEFIIGIEQTEYGADVEEFERAETYGHEAGRDDRHEAGHDDRYEGGKSPYQEHIELLSDACGNEFSLEEVKVLNDLMIEHVPHIADDGIGCFHYLHKMRNYMNMRNKKGPIENRFAYMKSLIGKEL